MIRFKQYLKEIYHFEPYLHDKNRIHVSVPITNSAYILITFLYNPRYEDATVSYRVNYHDHQYHNLDLAQRMFVLKTVDNVIKTFIEKYNPKSINFVNSLGHNRPQIELYKKYVSKFPNHQIIKTDKQDYPDDEFNKYIIKLREDYINNMIKQFKTIR